MNLAVAFISLGSLFGFGGETPSEPVRETIPLEQTTTKKKEKRVVENGICGLDARHVNEKLVALGFIPTSLKEDLRCFDEISYNATQAFQKYLGAEVDGAVGKKTRELLDSTERIRLKNIPNWAEWYRESGKDWSQPYVLVSISKQLLLIADKKKAGLVSNTSTGAPGHDTPTGVYTTYRKEEMSWSVPYEVWMPWSAYFTGGIATHENPDVPPYPASHGCVRLPAGYAKLVYDASEIGVTTVVVLP